MQQIRAGGYGGVEVGPLARGFGLNKGEKQMEAVSKVNGCRVTLGNLIITLQEDGGGQLVQQGMAHGCIRELPVALILEQLWGS